MEPAAPLKIALVALTYDKPEHATGLWQVIRQNWKSSPELRDCTLYHVYNGEASWYPSKTGEDVLVRRKNLGHIKGVLDMLNAGVQEVLESETSYDFIILCSSDAWITQAEPLGQTLRAMKDSQQHLLTSVWFGPRTWGSEWFAVSPQLAKASFPLVYAPTPSQKIIHRLGSVLHTFLPIFQAPLLEQTLTRSLRSGIDQLKLRDRSPVRYLPYRRFVWLHNRYETPQLGYTSDHDLAKKQRFLVE